MNKIKNQEELVPRTPEVYKKGNDGFLDKAYNKCYKCSVRRHYNARGICKDGFACNYTPGSHLVRQIL